MDLLNINKCCKLQLLQHVQINWPGFQFGNMITANLNLNTNLMTEYCHLLGYSAM
jgi:hypothetical protein